jgi:hypothetical protein
MKMTTRLEITMDQQERISIASLGLDRLDAAVRRALVTELFEGLPLLADDQAGNAGSVNDSVNEPLTPEQRTEVERRLADALTHPEASVDLADVERTSLRVLLGQTNR